MEGVKSDKETNDSDLDNLEMEFTSNSEYIASALNAISAVGELDGVMMKKGSKKKIEEIKDWALDIIHSCLQEMHDGVCSDENEGD